MKNCFMDLFWKISKNIIKDISSYSCWISVVTVSLDLNMSRVAGVLNNIDQSAVQRS